MLSLKSWPMYGVLVFGSGDEASDVDGFELAHTQSLFSDQANYGTHSLSPSLADVEASVIQW